MSTLARVRKTIAPGRDRLHERGQALLESAFVLLTTVMIILGTMDVGQVLMQIQFFNERARATVRWAVTHTNNETAIRNWACYGTSQGRNGNPPGLFGLKPENITVTRTNSGTANEVITVSISKQVQWFSPYITGRFTPRAAVVSLPVESLGASD